MGLYIGYSPRDKAFIVKESATKLTGMIVTEKKFGVLGAAGTIQLANCGTTSTTYSVTGTGSVNIASINVALGAVQSQVNALSNALKSFGFTL